MNLAIKMPDGQEIVAPTEEWLAALIVMLPPEDRRALCERVSKKIVAYKTPGSHILRAEGLDMSFKGTRLG